MQLGCWRESTRAIRQGFAKDPKELRRMRTSRWRESERSLGSAGNVCHGSIRSRNDVTDRGALRTWCAGLAVPTLYGRPGVLQVQPAELTRWGNRFNCPRKFPTAKLRSCPPDLHSSFPALLDGDLVGSVSLKSATCADIHFV